MAHVWKLEAEQIKDVIKESYHRDATFRRRSVVKAKGSPQIIPIEFAILLIHSATWRVRDQYSFMLFLQHYQQDISLEELAKRHRSHPDVITRRIEVMLDTVINQMPQHLANFILNIYDEFMRIRGEVCKSARGMLDKTRIKC
jgi:hypothetical protein